MTWRTPGLGGALVADGAGFGHAVMVEDARAGPELFQPPAGGGNAAARFAGHDDGADGRGTKVHVLSGGHFGQADGVAGGAAEDAGGVVNNRFEAAVRCSGRRRAGRGSPVAGRRQRPARNR